MKRVKISVHAFYHQTRIATCAHKPTREKHATPSGAGLRAKKRRGQVLNQACTARFVRLAPNAKKRRASSLCANRRIGREEEHVAEDDDDPAQPEPPH